MKRSPREPQRGQISQKELAEFYEHRRAIALHTAELKRLRLRFIGLVEGDAVVEGGPLALSVQTKSIRLPTRARLVEVLGEDETEWLLNRIEPTVGFYVKVKPCGQARDEKFTSRAPGW